MLDFENTSTKVESRKMIKVSELNNEIQKWRITEE